MEEKSRVNMVNAKFAFIFINPCFGTHAWHLPSLSHQFAPQFLHKLCDIFASRSKFVQIHFFVEATLALSPLTIQFL